MNKSFDLSIGNYTIIEMEEIFSLPNSYDESIIEIQETKLRKNIMNDKKIQISMKNRTLEFINSVKKKLINNLKDNNSSFQNNNIQSQNQYEEIYNLNTGPKKSETLETNSVSIIKSKETPHVNSQHSEYYEGTINPLKQRILRQNINIDTRFRENYYSTNASNFHVNLPLKMNEVVSMQLSALELSNTFYAISQVFGNNFFTLEIPGKDSLMITIPDGNYDPASLQDYINSVLKDIEDYNQIQFTSDINPTTLLSPLFGSGKMTVGLINGATISKFALNFLTDRLGNKDTQTPLPLKFGWLIGFRDGYYENNTNYVSEGFINLTGPKYIYLVVDDYNNNVLDGFYGAFTSSVLNKNIIARISLNGGVFNKTSNDNISLITNPRQYFGPVDIQKLQIQLLDEYGRILSLNNMDYSFCLTFQTIYNL